MVMEQSGFGGNDFDAEDADVAVFQDEVVVRFFVEIDGGLIGGLLGVSGRW